jgi:colanic acid biosynthesis glycosyl transferase WcaI
MHVLLMAQHYAPEEVSGAVLATELAEDLVGLGHEVTFVTCAPNYPEGRVFSGYKNRLFGVEMLREVRVVRTWSYISPSKSIWRRMLNFGTFSASAFYGGLLAGRADVVYSYSPPLPLGIAAWVLSRLWRVPWVLRVEDLYPEAAVAAGVLRNRVVIALFAALERFLYRRATRISLISGGFRENLLSKGVPAAKLSVIPVWADPEAVQPGPKENGFRREHNLAGKFVVMYAGALGLTSSLEDVMQAAWHLGDEDDVWFVLVGEGIKKEALIRSAQEKSLDRVTFLPFQPRTTYSELMAAADVSLVTLNPASSPYSLPSKVFSIMASGRPILAVVPLESEIAQLVQAGDCGVCVAPGQSRMLASMIMELKGDQERLSSLGHNGRVLLESQFSRRQCVHRTEELLRQARG